MSTNTSTTPPLHWLIDFARALGRETTADLSDFEQRAARVFYWGGESARVAAERTRRAA